MTDKEILSKAADLIEERGKCEGTYQDDTGALCAIGAISVAQGARPSDLTDAETRFGRWIASHGLSTHGIADWADRADKATVVATLRQAASEAL